MERRGFVSIGPIREILVLSILLAIVLSGLVNGVSVLKWNSTLKSETELNKDMNSVKSLDFNRDRQIYLAHTWPNQLCEIHAETGVVTPIQVPPAPLQIESVATSETGSTRIMVTYSTDSTEYPRRVYIVRGDDLILSQDVPIETSPLANVGISADGTIAILNGDAGTVIAIDLTTECPQQWKFNVGHVIFADRLSPDGNWLFASDGAGDAYIYNLKTGQRAVKIQIDRGCTRTAVWSRDSKHLALSDNDGGIYLVDSSDGKVLWSHEMDFLFARSLAISQDGTSLAVGGLGKQIFIWDLSISPATSPLVINATGVARNLRFADCGTSIVSGSDDGSICEWSLRTCQMIRKLR